MTPGEAEAVAALLGEYASSPSWLGRGRFHLERLWIEQDSDVAAVCLIFRQGERSQRLGCRQADLVSILTGDETVTAERMAQDLYHFVLVEPHDPEPLTPDADGVRWFTGP